MTTDSSPSTPSLPRSGTPLLTPWAALGGALIGLHIALRGSDELDLQALRRLVALGVVRASDAQTPDALRAQPLTAQPTRLASCLTALAFAPLVAAQPAWPVEQTTATQIIGAVAREMYRTTAAGPATLLVLAADRLEPHNSLIATDVRSLVGLLGIGSRECALRLRSLRLHCEADDWPLTGCLAAARCLDSFEDAAREARVLAGAGVTGQACAALAAALVGGRIGHGVLRPYLHQISPSARAEIAALVLALRPAQWAVSATDDARLRSATDRDDARSTERHLGRNERAEGGVR